MRRRHSRDHPEPGEAQAESPQLTELLAEVRMLRQAVETVAGVSVRVQIVFGRLQLQDQRVNTSQQRLDAIRERHARQSRRASRVALSLR